MPGPAADGKDRAPPGSGRPAITPAVVKAGIGLAFLPCGYADRDPGLRRLRPPEPGFGMDVWVLTHADLRNTARVRAFTDHAAAFYTARRAAFAGDAGNPPT